MLSVLTLLLDDRGSDGDPVCSSGANLFCTSTLGCLGGLMLILPFTVVHVSPVTEVEEVLCLGGSAGQLVSSHTSVHCALPVIHPSIVRGYDLFFGLAPRLFQGGLPLVDFLHSSEPICFSVTVPVLFKVNMLLSTDLSQS